MRVSSQTAQRRIKRAQELLEQVEADNKKLQALIRTIEASCKTATELDAYYHDPDQWLKDRDAVMKSVPQRAVTERVLSEDAVFNMLEERDRLLSDITKITRNSMRQ